MISLRSFSYVKKYVHATDRKSWSIVIKSPEVTLKVLNPKCGKCTTRFRWDQSAMKHLERFMMDLTHTFYFDLPCDVTL